MKNDKDVNNLFSLFSLCYLHNLSALCNKGIVNYKTFPKLSILGNVSLLNLSRSL